MKTNKRNTVFVLLTSIGFAVVVALVVIFAATKFFDGRFFLEVIFIALLVILAVLFAISLLLFFNQYTIIKTLQIENAYVLGKRSDFNNIFAFQRKVLAVSKFKRKGNHYVVVFTFSNLVVTQNVNRNNEILTLNSHIVDVLTNLEVHFKARRNTFIPAFSRGSFLLYAFDQNEQSLKQIIDYINEDIYAFAAKENQRVWVQPFFGVALVSGDQTIAQQIENASIARDYSERNFERITYYQPSFRRGVTKEDVNELSEALANEEFVVFYQPKFSINQKSFISSEALVRWNSKKYGLLAPNKFLGKAETAGLTHDIDTFVLKKVCEDLNDFRRRGKRLIPVSVNFSLYEFYSANFLDTIVSILEEYQIPTNLIEIEITEATSQANQFLSISIIKKLKERGIRVLMDDFGIGFSNVGNLRKIPFDAIKIDKSFIDDIAIDEKSREIVRFLVNLCKVNGMEVIAEGVDNKEQLEVLRKFKCDTIQGFFYSRPLSKADYEKFLVSNPFEKEGGTR